MYMYDLYNRYKIHMHMCILYDKCIDHIESIMIWDAMWMVYPPNSPTNIGAYVREYPNTNMARHMVQYLHFRIPNHHEIPLNHYKIP